jgi:AraC-like DNA-binding protein
MQHLEVPERAIQAFEKIHQLQVTIHDLRGSLGSAIIRERFQHRHPLCKCVKANGGEHRCATFEILKVRANIHACPEGRYHVCHAGLVEWMVPVFDNLELEWVLFAGVRIPGPDLGSIHREPLTPWQRSPWDDRTPMPPPVSRAEADLILEHLLQLAARLRAWARHRNRQLSPNRNQLDEMANSRLIQRRTLIRSYIEGHHTRAIRLRDLALQLKVSEDRATHLIRECCGQTFREMLIEARLKTAKELLRLSSLPILEVALCSGFNEISHFNRLFRQRTGSTPNQFRRKAMANSLLTTSVPAAR